MEESTTELHQILREQCIETKRELKVLHGIDGFSPIANVERVEDGAKITITDKTGTTEATVLDGPVGPRGPQGEPGPAAAWGEITGDIDNQGDLKAKLDGINTTISDFRDEYDGFTEEISTAIEEETEAREDADAGLQEQIDGITASSDVKDIVGTKADLDAYDKSTLGNNDIIKVISDSTHEDAMSYYRYDSATNAFVYIGKEGPFYTKAESDAEFAKATDLSSYVKKTDYATGTTGGVFRTGNGVTVNSIGQINGVIYSATDFEAKGDSYLTSKGSMKNYLAVHKYLMPEYTQTLPQTGAENKLYLVPTAEQPDVLNQTEGKEITLTDASEGNLEWGEIKGETSQESTSGKNILRNPNNEVSTIQGITYTKRPDGSVLVNGTSTARSYYYFNRVIPTAGTYMLSGCPTGGTTGTYMFEAHITKSGAESWPKDTGNGLRIEADSSTVIDCCILIQSGVTVNNLVYYPMLEAGTSVTDYEPYTAGASPNPTYPQEVKTVTGKNEIVVSGKNLFDVKKDLVEQTKNGVTVTYDESDGTITLNGSCTANNTVFYLTPNAEPLLLNGTYTLSTTFVSGSIANETNSTQIQFQSEGYEKSFKTYLKNQNTSIVYTAENTEFSRNNIRIDSGVVLNNYKVKFQLELGSTATTYEPYRKQSVEIDLSTNYLAQPFKDSTKTVNGITFTNNGDGTITIDGTATAEAIFWLDDELWQYNENQYLIPAGTYTLKGSGNNGVITRATFYRKTLGGAGTTNAGINDATVTLDEQASITARVTIASGKTFDNFIFKPELSSPIELLKIGTHQDRIYKDVEGWKLHKEVGKRTFTGSTSESWNQDGSNYAFIPLSDALGQRSAGYSDRFKVVDHTTNLWGDIKFGDSNQNLIFYQARVKGEGIEGWRTWLANNPTTVYYILQTPTDTLITNEALIEQLEALNTLATGKGYNLITTETENEKPTLQFSYYHPDPTVTKDEFLWVLNHYEQLGGHRRFTHNLSVNHHTAQGHWQYSFQLTTNTHEHFTHLYQIAKYISDNHSGLVLPVSGTYTEGNDTYIITKLEGYSANQVAIEMRKIPDASLRRITTGAVVVQDFIS